MLKEALENYIVKSSIYVDPSVPWIWLRIHKTGGTSIWDGYLRGIGGILNKAHNPSMYKRWLREDLPNTKNAFIWTFVRNPYDRFLSAAAMFDIPPEEFVKNFNTICEPELTHWRHTRPQHLFLEYNGQYLPNFTGRFENLQADFDKVCDLIDIPKIILPHLNKSEKRELTPKVIDFVNKTYERDFKLLNYKML